MWSTWRSRCLERHMCSVAGGLENSLRCVGGWESSVTGWHWNHLLEAPLPSPAVRGYCSAELQARSTARDDRCLVTKSAFSNGQHLHHTPHQPPPWQRTRQYLPRSSKVLQICPTNVTDNEVDPFQSCKSNTQTTKTPSRPSPRKSVTSSKKMKNTSTSSLSLLAITELLWRWSVSDRLFQQTPPSSRPWWSQQTLLHRFRTASTFWKNDCHSQIPQKACVLRHGDSTCHVRFLHGSTALSAALGFPHAPQ